MASFNHFLSIPPQVPRKRQLSDEEEADEGVVEEIPTREVRRRRVSERAFVCVSGQSYQNPTFPAAPSAVVSLVPLAAGHDLAFFSSVELCRVQFNQAIELFNISKRSDGKLGSTKTRGKPEPSAKRRKVFFLAPNTFLFRSGFSTVTADHSTAEVQTQDTAGRTISNRNGSASSCPSPVVSSGIATSAPSPPPATNNVSSISSASSCPAAHNETAASSSAAPPILIDTSANSPSPPPPAAGNVIATSSSSTPLSVSNGTATSSLSPPSEATNCPASSSSSPPFEATDDPASSSVSSPPKATSASTVFSSSQPPEASNTSAASPSSTPPVASEALATSSSYPSCSANTATALSTQPDGDMVPESTEETVETATRQQSLGAQMEVDDMADQDMADLAQEFELDASCGGPRDVSMDHVPLYSTNQEMFLGEDCAEDVAMVDALSDPGSTQDMDVEDPQPLTQPGASSLGKRSWDDEEDEHKAKVRKVSRAIATPRRSRRRAVLEAKSAGDASHAAVSEFFGQLPSVSFGPLETSQEIEGPTAAPVFDSETIASKTSEILSRLAARAAPTPAGPAPPSVSNTDSAPSPSLESDVMIHASVEESEPYLPEVYDPSSLGSGLDVRAAAPSPEPDDLPTSGPIAFDTSLFGSQASYGKAKGAVRNNRKHRERGVPYAKPASSLARRKPGRRDEDEDEQTVPARLQRSQPPRAAKQSSQAVSDAPPAQLPRNVAKMALGGSAIHTISKFDFCGQLVCATMYQLPDVAFARLCHRPVGPGISGKSAGEGQSEDLTQRLPAVVQLLLMHADTDFEYATQERRERYRNCKGLLNLIREMAADVSRDHQSNLRLVLEQKGIKLDGLEPNCVLLRLMEVEKQKDERKAEAAREKDLEDMKKSVGRLRWAGGGDNTVDSITELMNDLGEAFKRD